MIWSCSYTCQLFLRYKRKIFILGVLGFLKMTRSFPKIPEEFRSLPKMSEVCRRLSFHLLFTSKIRDREEGIVIYSFYTWFSFLTWVWVNIFLEIASSTHISIRREKLARKREPAWDRSFQPAGVRVGRYMFFSPVNAIKEKRKTILCFLWWFIIYKVMTKNAL